MPRRESSLISREGRDLWLRKHSCNWGMCCESKKCCFHVNVPNNKRANEEGNTYKQEIVHLC